MTNGTLSNCETKVCGKATTGSMQDDVNIRSSNNASNNDKLPHQNFATARTCDSVCIVMEYLTHTEVVAHKKET